MQTQVSQAQIDSICNVAGFLNFKPNFLLWAMEQCPQDIVALFTGNQGGKNRSIDIDYYSYLFHVLLPPLPLFRQLLLIVLLPTEEFVRNSIEFPSFFPLQIIFYPDSFLIFAFVFFAISPALGISLSLIWPAFLTLPFALFQIFQVRGISLGAPANWPLLTATALAVFGLTTYFLTLTFWLR